MYLIKVNVALIDKQQCKKPFEMSADIFTCLQLTGLPFISVVGGASGSQSLPLL